MPTPLSLLNTQFGYSAFRFNQEKIIDTVLAGRDAFVLMPTGGGKSLCYQIPALMFSGLTVVISPLISLMKDQVDALRLNGIKAAYLNSSLKPDERSEIFAQLEKNQLKLLYIAPERLFNNEQQFIDFLQNVKVSLFAIDETHCISHWGHDFRPEYRLLSSLKKYFPRVPTIALTATADDLTRRDILDKLQLIQPEIFSASFNRPNIHYFVEPKRGLYEKVTAYLAKHRSDSGIIYVLSRGSAENLADKLTRDGFSAKPYHAGLTPAVRQKNQDLFIRDRVKIIVATIAFGMGINKSNIRFVLHADLPKNIESYYQETGRAGRDGLKSEAVLYYSGGDVIKLKKFALIENNPEQSRIMLNKLAQMAALCENHLCRRKSILNYFGEEAPDNCGSCDVCLNEYEKFDATIIAQKALSAVARLNSGFGLTYVVDFLRGSKSEKIREVHKSLPTYGAGADIPKESWFRYFKDLIAFGYLKQTGSEYPLLSLTPKSLPVLKGLAKVMLGKSIAKKVATAAEQPYEEELLIKLKSIRNNLARQANVPAYIIFSDATMLELAVYLPQTKEELKKISGFGEVKIAKYGGYFLNAVIAYSRAKGLKSNIAAKLPKRERLTKTEKESDTKALSYGLFRRGQSAAKIASQRGLAISTIESHLAFYVLEGKIKISELVPEKKIPLIAAAVKKFGNSAVSPIKEALGDDFSYGEIRAVINHLRRGQK